MADQVILKEGSKVLEGVVIGKDSSIGRRVLIKPNVRIWPNKQLEDRTILTSSLVWGNRSPQHLFGNSGVSGTANVEITPEYAAKLGAAFGCSLGSRARVAVTADGGKAARVMKRAAISGLLSTGVDVADLGVAIVPVLSQVILGRGLSGGLMVCSPEPDQLTLEFYDSSGLLLSKGARRGLENLFFREDFTRPAPKYMGEISFLPSANESYVDSLFKKLESSWAGSRLRVVLCPGGPGSKAVAEVVKRKAPKVFAISQVGEPSGLGELTQKCGADVGMWLGPTGEEYSIADEAGVLLTEDVRWNLLVYGLLLTGRKQVAVPITAPGSVERIAAKFAAEVARTKADPRSVLEQERPPVGLPAYDGFAALSLIIKVMLQTGLTLSRIREDFPVPARKSTKVQCSWEAKGKVMRSLLEATSNEQVQLLDGVKVFHQEGWALVWPDAEEPLFHILSEAQTVEEADALSQLYAAKISQLIS